MTDARRIRSAIDHIRTAVDVDEWAMEIAVDAMEKEIPKKPQVIVDAYSKNLCRLYCPTCGAWIGRWDKRLKTIDWHNNTNINICAMCGQTIRTDIERRADKP